MVRCDQRARRSVNETGMNDERAAQRRVECTLHSVIWFVMSTVNCCPGRRCRIVKSRSRRGAAQRCRCTCACVCCQHTSIARRRARVLPRSLPTTTTTTPARAPFAVRRAQRRQRAGVLRRLVGGLVSAPLEHVAPAAAASSGVVVRCLLESVAPAVKNAVECAPLHDLARHVQV